MVLLQARWINGDNTTWCARRVRDVGVVRGEGRRQIGWNVRSIPMPCWSCRNNSNACATEEKEKVAIIQGGNPVYLTDTYHDKNYSRLVPVRRQVSVTKYSRC
jgi:hypothetical protein